MSWYREVSKTDVYCEPPKLALTGNQLMEILQRQSASKELISKSPWGLGLLYALKVTFPCPDKKP